MIEKYKLRIEKKLKRFEWLFIDLQIEIDQLTKDTLIIKGQIIFLDDSILEFNEYMSTDDHDYRFHYMDQNKNMISRWDSAPHHPEIYTHPFHMHYENQILPSERVTLENILDQIMNIVIDNLYFK